jgi:hypothetical protein
VGFTLVEDLGVAALHARYCRDRTDGLCPKDTVHVARAKVAV